MELKKYYRKIARLEAFAADYPGRYRRNLVLIIIGGIIPLAILVVGGFAAIPFLFMSGHIWLIVFIAVFEWAVIAALVCKIRAPGVIDLSPETYHDLYLQMDKLRLEINGPKIHRIMLNLDFNAAVYQSLFRRNTLVIGYPLAASMSYEHFIAVIAHEIGHLSKDHNRFSNFVFRLNYALRNAFGSGLIQAVVLFPFIRFYVPFLEYYSMGMLKNHEYEADRFAAKAMSPQIVAEALFYTELNSIRMNDDISIAIVEHIKRFPVPEPDFSFCRLVSDKYRERLDDSKLKEYAGLIMNHRAMPGDPHPSLKERIAALGVRLPVRAAAFSPAAEKLFSDAHGAVIDRLDEIYREYSVGEWSSAHAYYADCAERLVPLEKVRKQRKLTAEETVQYLAALEAAQGETAALEAAQGETAALEAARAAVEEFPANLNVKFYFGRLLLAARDPRGVEVLRQSMRDPANIPGGMEILEEYLYNHGRTDELIEFMDFAENNIGKTADVYKKLQRITSENEFFTHDLGPAAIGLAVAQLEKYKCIAAAYLVKYRHPEVAGANSYLLAFTVRTLSFARQTPQEIEAAILREINFPYLLVVKNYSDGNRIMKKIKAVGNSRIWPQKSEPASKSVAAPGDI